MTQIVPRYFCSSALKLVGFTPRFKSTKNYDLYRGVGNQKYATKCSDAPVYKTRLATWKDHNDILAFMVSCYFRYDPVMVNIGLDKVPPSLVLMKLVHHQLKHGATLIAHSVDDGCLIAVAINISSGPLDVKRLSELSECCGRGPVRDLLDFFAHVTGKPNLWERFCVPQLLECSYLAVDPGYQCLGIARRLVQQSWLLARDCGYRLFRIDCTSRYSAKIAAGFGWQCVYTIPYCRYVKDGELVFKHIEEPHTEVQVYVDPITLDKDPFPTHKKGKFRSKSSGTHRKKV